MDQNNQIKHVETIKKTTHEARQKVTNIFSLVWLLFNSYRRRFQGPYFNFIQPLIIIIIYGTIISVLAKNYHYHNASFDSQLIGLIPGIIATTSFGVATSSLTVILLGLKETIMFKRIAITPITKTQFLTSSVIFVIMMCFVSGLWSWGWMEVFYHTEISGAFSYLQNQKGFEQNSLGWLFFFIGWFLVITLSTSMGLLVVGVSRNVQMGLGISQLLFFPSAIFGGGILSPALMQNSPALRWISFFVPLRYPIQVAREGFFGQNIFAPNSNNFLSASAYGNVSAFTSGGFPDWFALIMAVVFIGWLMFTAKRTFKWE